MLRMRQFIVEFDDMRNRLEEYAMWLEVLGWDRNHSLWGYSSEIQISTVRLLSYHLRWQLMQTTLSLHSEALVVDTILH